MRKVFEIVKKSAGLWLALIIIAQTVIYVLAGMSKAYFHMDEVYSYGLANHERVQIYETEGFYDTWHEGSYYDEYLTVGDDERGDFWPVYENQRNDVHPPLFYFLLRDGNDSWSVFEVDRISAKYLDCWGKYSGVVDGGEKSDQWSKS